MSAGTAGTIVSTPPADGAGFFVRAVAAF